MSVAALTYSVSAARTKNALKALAQLLDFVGPASAFAEALGELAWESGGALPPPPVAAAVLGARGESAAGTSYSPLG